MVSGKKPVTHKVYHESFRMKVISLLETGEYTISELNRTFEIGGSNTIRKWLRRYGKEHLIGRREYIIKAADVDQLQRMKERIRAIESKLKEAENQLKDMTISYIYEKSMNEASYEVMTEEQKKKFLSQLSAEQLLQFKQHHTR